MYWKTSVKFVALCVAVCLFGVIAFELLAKDRADQFSKLFCSLTSRWFGTKAPPPLPISWKKSSCLLHHFFPIRNSSCESSDLLLFFQLVSLINNSWLNLTVRPISFKFPELHTTFDVFSSVCIISNRFIYVSHTVLFKMESYEKFLFIQSNLLLKTLRIYCELEKKGIHSDLNKVCINTRQLHFYENCIYFQRPVF